MFSVRVNSSSNPFSVLLRTLHYTMLTVRRRNHSQYLYQPCCIHAFKHILPLLIFVVSGCLLMELMFTFQSLKYWRSRFFLLPSNKHATKWIAEGKTTRCDIYEEWTAGERNELTDAFLRFIEHLNKIKRTAQGRLIKV